MDTMDKKQMTISIIAWDEISGQQHDFELLIRYDAAADYTPIEAARIIDLELERHNQEDPTLKNTGQRVVRAAGTLKSGAAMFKDDRGHISSLIWTPAEG